MREAGVVLNRAGQPIYWHVPEDRLVHKIPDSQAIWDFTWANKDEILGIGHSHPGGGIPGPSYEDVTTFSANELGLGRRLEWWITSSDAMVVCRWVGPGKYDYVPIVLTVEPHWADELRRRSVGLTDLVLRARYNTLAYLQGKGPRPSEEEIVTIQNEWSIT